MDEIDNLKERMARRCDQEGHAWVEITVKGDEGRRYWCGWCDAEKTVVVRRR